MAEVSAGPTLPTPFELPLAVADGDIDELGHVNNVVYLRWVQDVAVAHWRALTTAAQLAAVMWVVIRHEIDYKRPAMRGDALVARTWVGEASGLTFQRHTEILRAADRKLLARARTLWCPIEPGSLKPMQVPDDVRALVSAPKGN